MQHDTTTAFQHRARNNSVWNIRAVTSAW